ncbi:MAG: hypothetical protein JW902_03200, partial [Syntrophaceae bacterium]|nr:hypothetical protein [Syntrophaceae bacterium]
MAINDVSLTSGMRSNLLSLQGTVDLLNRTQSRLSTGKKVNSAIDNPVSFFASQALNSRASVIDSLKDAMGQAVQTISAADKGIKAITAMIEQAKGIAQSAQSAAAGTTETEDLTGVVEHSYATVSLDITSMIDTEAINIEGTGDLVKGTNFSNAAELATAIEALGGGGVYTAEVSGDVVTVSKVGANIDADDIASAASVVETNNAEVAASTYTVGSTPYTAGVDFAVVEGDDEATAANLAAVITADGLGEVSVDGTEVTVILPSDELASLEEQYNTLLTQLTELAGDSGYKGKNLLAGETLTVQFEGVNLDVVGFNAAAGVGGLEITDATWTIGGDVDADIGLLDAALVTLRQESSKMSGNLSIITVRQEFSTNMINTLTEGADKLTLADTNEEGANMLMLQT